MHLIGASASVAHPTVQQPAAEDAHGSAGGAPPDEAATRDTVDASPADSASAPDAAPAPDGSVEDASSSEATSAGPRVSSAAAIHVSDDLPDGRAEPGPADEPADAGASRTAATVATPGGAEVAAVQAGLIQHVAANEYQRAIVAIAQREQVFRGALDQQRAAVRIIAATEVGLARTEARSAVDRVRERNRGVGQTIRHVVDGEITRMSLGTQDAMGRVSAASRAVIPAVRSASDQGLTNANLDLRPGEGERALSILPEAREVAISHAKDARYRDATKLAEARDANIRGMREAGEALIGQVATKLPDVERAIQASGEQLVALIEHNAVSALAALDATERAARAFFGRARTSAGRLLENGRATAATLTLAAAQAGANPDTTGRFQGAAAHVAPQLARQREQLLASVEHAAGRATTATAPAATDFQTACSSHRAVALGNYATAEGKLAADVVARLEQVRGEWAKNADTFLVSANSFAAAVESNRSQVIAQLPARFAGIARSAVLEGRKSRLRRFGEGVWNTGKGLVKTLATFVAAALIIAFAPFVFGVAALLGQAGRVAGVLRDAALAVVAIVDGFAERYRILFRTWDDWPWYGKLAGLWTTNALVIGDMVGLPSIVEGATGRELLSNRELSYDERGAKTAGGAIAAATSVVPAHVQASRRAVAEVAEGEARAASTQAAGAESTAPSTAEARASAAPRELAEADAPAAALRDAADQQLVLQGADTEIAEYARNVKPKPGTLDVFLHGDVDDFIVKTPDGGQVRISHRSLALYIKKSGIRYERVRLIACKSGMHPQGVAQHLANKLKVIVEAPTDKVHILGDGTLVVGPRSTVPTGRWVEYGHEPSRLRYSPAKEPSPPTVRDRLQQRRASRAEQQPVDEPAAREVTPPTESGVKTFGTDDVETTRSLFDEYADDATYADDPSEWLGGENDAAPALPPGLQDDPVSMRTRREPQPSPDRPTWQESEQRVSGELEGSDFTDQRSFVNGKDVPRGTPGSVRPDSYSHGHRLSVDVKNYDVATRRGRARLVDDVADQVRRRVAHLPEGTRQGVVIDVRGQAIGTAEIDAIVQGIQRETKGLIDVNDIVFLRTE